MDYCYWTDGFNTIHRRQKYGSGCFDTSESTKQVALYPSVTKILYDVQYQARLNNTLVIKYYIS